METIEITARYISENARMNFMPAAFRGAFFSADHCEVGIIVCLYAYSYFCGLAYEEGKAELNETMANRYHLLREYVNTLENESQNRIYRAID